MNKALHKVFKAVVNNISQAFPVLGESCSKISYFIPEPTKFVKGTRLSKEIKKPWLK